MTKLSAMALCSCLLVGLLPAAQDKKPQVVHDFRVPDYDERGQLRSEIMGDTARLMDDGRIAVTLLRMNLYEEGKVAMRAFADECVFDRATQTAVSDARVRVEREDVTLSGLGFTFNIKERSFKIFDQTRVELKNVRKRTDLGLELGGSK
ncbi:MAG: hypothetical protein HY343_05385 [Lentisphaerae bacterium]|nr:hypothetical protein [Lentisphaerota bacterium]